MENKKPSKLFRYVIYTCFFILLALVGFALGIFYSYKPLTAEYKYHKAVKECDDVYYKECKKLMNAVISYAPGTDAAKKADHYIKHKLPLNINIPESIIEKCSEAYNKYKNKQYDESLTMLKEVNKEFPKYEYPYYLMAFIYNYKNDCNAAIDCLNTGIKINPSYYDFSLELAYTYFLKGRKLLTDKNLVDAQKFFKLSIEIFQQIAKDPINASYYPQSYETTFEDDVQDAKDHLELVNRKLKLIKNK